MSRRTPAGKRRAGRGSPRRPRRGDRWLWPVAAGIVLVGVLAIVVIVLATPRPADAGVAGAAATTFEVSLDRGRQLYDANCAACHGTNGAGYALRGLPAPALDATEHAWHHPDEQILALLRRGGTQMPAVGARWSDDDLASVLAYVKQWWTPDQRRAQQGTIGE